MTSLVFEYALVTLLLYNENVRHLCITRVLSVKQHAICQITGLVACDLLVVEDRHVILDAIHDRQHVDISSLMYADLSAENCVRYG